MTYLLFAINHFDFRKAILNCLQISFGLETNTEKEPFLVSRSITTCLEKERPTQCVPYHSRLIDYQIQFLPSTIRQLGSEIHSILLPLLNTSTYRHPNEQVNRGLNILLTASDCNQSLTLRNVADRLGISLFYLDFLELCKPSDNGGIGFTRKVEDIIEKGYLHTLFLQLLFNKCLNFEHL